MKQRLTRITNNYNIYGSLELYYVDNEQDKISIISEEDWVLFLERKIEQFYAKVLLSPAELALSNVVACRVATPHISSEPLVAPPQNQLLISNEPVVFGPRGDMPYLETNNCQHITCFKPYLPHAPGVAFQKVWRVYNRGKPWPADTSVVFLSRPGDISMSESYIFPVGPVPSHTCRLVVVPMRTPAQPGSYRGAWTLARKNEQGQWVPFGQLLTIHIEVVSATLEFALHPNSVLYRHKLQIEVLLRHASEDKKNPLHAMSRADPIKLNKVSKKVIKAQLASLGII